MTSEKSGMGRRDFLTGVSLGAAALAVTATATAAADAQTGAPPAGAAGGANVADSGARSATGPQASAAAAPIAGASRYGSDFMIDVLRTLDIEYCAINPGSTFEGLQESIINHAGNTRPELLTCLHEEAAAAMAHSYAKASGKPMMIMVHGTVGLLHASMAIFQAYADRVPLIVVVAHNRNPSSIINRPHSAQDMGALVRDFVKWDDEPTTLENFAESAVRAYTIALTPPRGPVLLVVDSKLQEMALPAGFKPYIPVLSIPSPPAGDSNAVREAARLLVAGERPLIRIQKVARTPKGWDLVLELAELLQAPVNVGTYGSWQDFPSWHPLYGSGGPDYVPDVTLGLEQSDMAEDARTARANGGKTISICSESLAMKSNIHVFGPYSDVDVAIAADAEATLPALIEEVRRQSNRDRLRVYAARGKRVTAAHRKVNAALLEDAKFGWDESPVSVPRMIAELGEQIKNDDWAIVSGHQFTGDWQRRLLNFDKHYRYNGDCGGFGIGYDAPGCVGAALAHAKQGRLSIGIIGDGDFNFVGPGALWTAAHHKIPLLLVIHNNRAYHAELMLVQRIAGSRGRGAGRAHIGNMINDPNPDYARIAQGYGVYSEGPIENPADLAPAYKRALARVRAGEPALVDVVSQPR